VRKFFSDLRCFFFHRWHFRFHEVHAYPVMRVWCVDCEDTWTDIPPGGRPPDKPGVSV
jgi:hypothetical protein